MTQSRKTTTLQRLSAVALAAMCLSGCAAMSGKRAPEEIVRDRAAQRAQAFVKGDLDASYSLTAPSYRKSRNLEAYKRSFGPGAKWERAEVKSVSCEPERCKVAIQVGVKPLIGTKFGDTIAVQFEETWLLEDGNWWLHQGL